MGTKKALRAFTNPAQAQPLSERQAQALLPFTQLSHTSWLCQQLGQCPFKQT